MTSIESETQMRKVTNIPLTDNSYMDSLNLHILLQNLLN